MNPLYDTIGTGYDVTRHADPRILQTVLSLLQPFPRLRYLDLGCGTGNYTSGIADAAIDICGVDPSDVMLSYAREKFPSLSWVHGSATSIPFPDRHFDGITAILTIHHWTDLEKGFSECARVLKPGGRLVIFTSTPSQMKSYWLNPYFPEMMRRSMAQMPGMSTITGAMERAGFALAAAEKFYVDDQLQDLFLYSGKTRPELYLDERIRKGISSFTRLSEPGEVSAGLKKLEADIATGEFAQVSKRFANNEGDYLFLKMSRVE